MNASEHMAAVEAILFASGEPISVRQISRVLELTQDEVLAAADLLKQDYLSHGRGIRLLQLEDRLQLCSAPEFSELVTQALEQRKPPKLSNAALEVLAIVAYFQPVTRSYIDQVRGVDSAYTVSVLLERGLIEPAGKLEVPGRPVLFRTADAFLRTMNISSVEELPALPDISTDEGIIALQNKIDALRSDQEASSEPEETASEKGGGTVDSAIHRHSDTASAPDSPDGA